MEKFENKRAEDLQKYFAEYSKGIAKGWITPQMIFEHAYNLGALAWSNKDEKETN